MPRYKLICQASVGENNGQSMRMASRCLWDKDYDTCASVTWTNVGRSPSAHAPVRSAQLTRGAPLAEPGVRRCDVLCAVLRVMCEMPGAHGARLRTHATPAPWGARREKERPTLSPARARNRKARYGVFQNEPFSAS